MKDLVELLEPSHHLIHILQCIKNRQSIIPLLHLPTNFILSKHVQEKIWSPLTTFHGRQSVSLFLHQEIEADVVNTIFTTFILLHASHPICISLIQFFPCNTSMLLQLSIKEEWQIKAPLLFTPLSKMYHLKQFIDEQKGILNEKWNSMDWKCAFIDEYSIHPFCEDFLDGFPLIYSDSSQRFIIHNKYLQRFLILLNKSQYSFSHLLDDPEYKFDVLLRKYSLKYLNCEILFKWMDEKKEFIAALSPVSFSVIKFLLDNYEMLLQHPAWQHYANDLDIQLAFFEMIRTRFVEELKTFFEKVAIPLHTTQNKSLVQKWLYHCPNVYLYLDESMKTDREVALAAAHRGISTHCVEQLLHKFLSDRQIVKRVIPLISKSSPSLFQSIVNTYENDANFIKELVTLNAALYAYLPLHQMQDKVLITVALQNNGLLLQKVPTHCIIRDVVIIAVKSNGMALEFAQHVEMDETIQTLAVRQCKLPLKHIKTPSEKILKSTLCAQYT